MHNKCCVVACDSRRKDVKLFIFPKTEKRLEKWLESINCDNLRSLSFEELHKNFVCQKHFEKRFLKSTNRLLFGAYPTLFTEEEIAGGKPLNAKENMDRIDHNYCRKRRHEDHSYSKLDVEKPAKILTVSNMQPRLLSTPRRSAGRRRLIHKLKSLTPNCNKL